MLRNFQQNHEEFDEKNAKSYDLSRAELRKSWRSRKMLKNDYLDAKVSVDTAENEPRKE